MRPNPTYGELNFILETVNGIVAILTFFLLVFLTSYLLSEHTRNNMPSLRRLFITGLPAGMTLALSLYIEKSGALLTRGTVWVWRRMGVGGGGGPMTHLETQAMLLGAAMMAVGLLSLIAVLSRPKYGNWPWIMSGILTVGYIIYSCLTR